MRQNESSLDVSSRRLIRWLSRHHLLVIPGIICILISAAGFYWNEARDKEVPAYMTQDAQAGDYCMLDVQYMTTWLLKTSSDRDLTYVYCIADDTGENYYLVRLAEGLYDDLSEIIDYSYSDDPAPAPPTRQLKGTVRSIPYEIQESLLDGMRWSEEEFSDAFHGVYLDVNSDSYIFIFMICFAVMGVGVFLLAMEGCYQLELCLQRRKAKKAYLKSHPWEKL